MTTRDRLQRYLDRPLDDLLEELDMHDPDCRGPTDAWNKIAGRLHQRLCVEWDWCRVRQDAHWENDLDLALAVVAALLTRGLNLYVPADLALVAAIVVKRGLDAFCGCP